MGPRIVREAGGGGEDDVLPVAGSDEEDPLAERTHGVVGAHGSEDHFIRDVLHLAAR